MGYFGKIGKRRLSEIIAEKVEQGILEGKFKFGERLPSEQALADEFGVSRNVVREAFKILQERGLITVQDGAGAYVSQPSSETFNSAFGRYARLTGADSSLTNLYEARKALEATIARLAAERADEKDLEQLAQDLCRMTEHRDSVGDWTDADLDFHLTLATATHNPFFTLLLQPLIVLMRGVIAEGFLLPGSTDSGLAAHNALYECIAHRDPEGAAQAMQNHLSDSEARVRSSQAEERTASR